MAMLIKTEALPAGGDLAKICTHPMFEDLQATLTSECYQNFQTLPFSLCREGVAPMEEEAEPVILDPALIAVQEANLQSDFQRVFAHNSEKVHQLHKFYSEQCQEVETDRCSSIDKLKTKEVDASFYQSEINKIHEEHDRQRMHLTHRVTASLQLLKVALPSAADSTTATTASGSGRSKSRQLNGRGVTIMCDWYEKHINNPYPSEEEKEKMARDGSLSLAQVKAWFANKRNRTSNTKPKKQKQQVERKLLSICSGLTGSGGTTDKAPRLYGDIIRQLSDIVNSSTVFSQPIGSDVPSSQTVIQ
ncbi:pre-B-cell leukemia transcription factor 4-like [Mizuhopecten yessoensis]|uniref:pre-B-cell leukemia transcription factor 4-like n=1 Tax=Mizuhopecten yessoensis TaxID=6573 RepID=UPI000B45BF50|nr:pre-B-cell leukemia transcription factor 4-like [Mizuhopecten yessoensis]